MELLGKVGGFIIVVIALVIGLFGLAVFGPFVLMILFPLLIIVGCVWILRQYRKNDGGLTK